MIVEAVQWQADHFEEVPVIVVPCLHGRAPVFGSPVLAASYYGSIFPAVQNLLLAARAVGLGATLTTLPLWSGDPGPPDPGAPGSSPRARWSRSAGRRADYGPTTRRPVEEVVHLDRYGNQPFSGTARAAAPAEAVIEVVPDGAGQRWCGVLAL